MTRAAYPLDLVRAAFALRERGWSYHLIGLELGVGDSTVRDWVRYYSRPLGAPR